ncbi:hypothetical protein ACFLZK_00020 [Patescibacteria group bacterium]
MANEEFGIIKKIKTNNGRINKEGYMKIGDLEYEWVARVDYTDPRDGKEKAVLVAFKERIESTELFNCNGLVLVSQIIRPYLDVGIHFIDAKVVEKPSKEVRLTPLFLKFVKEE